MPKSADQQKRQQKKTAVPNQTDIYAGMRLRQLRMLVGISQEKLADALGVTFQQIQKYENAQNRISVSRLADIARFLNVSTSYFFLDKDSVTASGFTEDAQSQLDGVPDQDTSKEVANFGDLMGRRETLDLVRAWYQISDMKQRRKILDMIRSLSEIQ